MSTPQGPSDRLVELYGSDLHESRRLLLANSRLEFLRTQQLVRARLRAPPARVLDVGGGTGVHAAWLAAEGYDVMLVDIVPEHVRVARELSAQLPRQFSAQVGYARALPEPDGAVDACLLLGPLYHLPERCSGWRPWPRRSG